MLTICVFNITEHCLFLYDGLLVKKQICRCVSDSIDNSASFFALEWTKFHVKLRNFYLYGLILVSYKNVYFFVAFEANGNF